MNVLFIGLGSIAKKHVSALRSIEPKVNISALRSGIAEGDVEGVKNIGSITEIEQEPDFIIISNPTHKHLDSIRECLAFNKPLFIEKPVAHQMDGLREVIEEVRSREIQTYVACNLRFLESLRFIKDLIVQKKPVINEVNVYCGSYLPEWRPGTDHKSSYSADKNMGGGVHLDLIHELDYVYWIFGEPLSVYKKLSSKSNLEINATDRALFDLEYPKFYASIILNYFRRDAKRTLEIVFDNDTLVVDLVNNKVTSMLKNETVFSSLNRIVDTYATQMRYFIDHLKDRRPLMNNIEEASNVLKICVN